MYQAPHEVRDQQKLGQMVELLESGGTLPPVIVCGDRAISGTHRLAAWEACGMDPEVIEILDVQLAEAMVACGLDPVYDEIEDFGAIEDALEL